MKRSSKILALLLSVALICGALIVASFATAEDATVYKATDFEELTVGQTATASDGTNPTWDNMVFQQGGRTGKIEVVAGSDGNKYAVITQTDKVGKDGPYAWTGVGTRPSTTSENGVVTDFTKATTDISNYKFIKFELDVMSPTGKFIAGNIDLSARKVGADGSVGFWNTNATSTIVKFGNDNGGSYIYAGYDSTVKKYVNPYEFTKIELIVENTSTADALGVTTHAYVNGELWFTKVASNVPAADQYFGGRLNASFIEYRINYLANTEDPTQTLGLDNAIWSYVPAGSETTVADLVSYDAENRPAGLVVATVGGVDYNTLEGAIAAADENSTIDVLVSKYTPTTVSKNITLNAGTNVLNIVAGEGYKLQTGRGLYKVVEGITATGVTTKRSDTMDALVGNTASSGNPSGTSHGWTMSGRWGKVDKYVNFDGNAYLVYTNADKAGNNGTYFGTGYGGAGTTARPTINATTGVLTYTGSIEFNPYVVVDYDVASPAGEFADANVNMQTRFATGLSTDGKNTTVLDSATHSPAAYAVRMSSDDNGSYIDVGGTKKYVDPGEFTHVTIIFAGDMATVSYGAHVYINGEYFNSIAPQDNTEKGFYQGIAHLTWDEVRFNLGSGTTATNGKQLAFDNIVTRVIGETYNGNLADVLSRKLALSSWESNLYDAEFAPYAIPDATIGEVTYADIADAIADAAEDDVITVWANLGTVEVGAAVTIDTNGFAAEIVAAEGYAIIDENPADTIVEVVDVTSFGSIELTIDECFCEEFCDYANHPFYEVIEAYAYTKYFNLIDTETLFKFDGKFYKIVGLKKITDYDPVTFEIFASEDLTVDSMVTLEEIEAGAPIYVVTVWEEADVAFEYVKGGETVYAGSTATLETVFAAADAGTTIKFHKDYTSDAVVNVNKNITFDLNGKTYNATTNGAKDNFGAFKASTTAGFTITSSVPGAKIFMASISGTQAKGDPFITTTADNVVINFKGNDAEGNTTLRFYGPTLVQAWSNNGVVLNIDGGEYYRTASDNQGFVQLQGTLDFDAKNALFWGEPIFHFYGRYAPASETYNSFATVDNCVLIGSVTNYSFKELEFVITNSYIKGSIPATGVYSGETAGKITLGEGNRLDATLAENVVLAEGLESYEISSAKTVTLTYNTYTITDGAFAASSFEVDEYVNDYAFNKYITEAGLETITVTWTTPDGTVMGTSEVLPGTVAEAPADLDYPILGALVEGWLGYTYGEWETDLLVPADATEYTIVAKEGGATKPIVDVELLFNIRTQSHNQICFYFPAAAEGIEFVSAAIGTTDRTKALSNVKINDRDFKLMAVWPGVVAAATANWEATVVFKYEGVQYTFSASANMGMYAETVLTESYGYKDPAKNLVVNAANYIVKGLELRGGSDTAVTAKLREVLANNTSRIIAPTAADIVAADTTAMSQYVSSAQVVIDDSTPMIRFNLTAEGSSATVKLNVGSTTGTGYIQTKGGQSIGTFDIFTVTVNEEVSLTYTLGNYIYALQGDAENEKAVALLTALYGYVKADVAY